MVSLQFEAEEKREIEFNSIWDGGTTVTCDANK